MKVWMLWHGGSGYAHGYVDDDTEYFASLYEAKHLFDSRANSWNTYYPCVDRIPAEDGGPSAYIYFSDPRDDIEGDPYPDRILEYGPRGGLHVNRT